MADLNFRRPLSEGAEAWEQGAVLALGEGAGFHLGSQI